MYVLDSSAVIELFQDLPRANGIRDVLRGAPLVTTTITMHEVLAGAQTEREQFICEGLFSGMRLLNHDIIAARTGARMQRELDRAGTKINKADVLIAGICEAHGGEMLALDRDFLKIKGLKAQVL